MLKNTNFIPTITSWKESRLRSFFQGWKGNDEMVWAIYQNATRVIPSLYTISVDDNTDYKKWSESHGKLVESFKLDEGRFVKFEDRKNESILTSETYEGISKGKKDNTLIQSPLPHKKVSLFKSKFFLLTGYVK